MEKEDGQRDENGWEDEQEKRGCQGEITEQQDENGPECVYVCWCRERKRQWRSTATAGVSNWSQEPQQMLLLLLLANGLQPLI